MAAKNSVFGKIIAVFLVLIIISGSGFLAYNLLSGSIGGMDMATMDTGSANKDQSKEKTTNNTDTSNQEMNMDENSSNNSMNMEDSTAQSNSQYSTQVISAVLQNKDELEKTMVTLKESLSLITLDPNSAEEPNTNSAQEQATSETTDQTTETKDNQGNTIINVYPQDGTTQTTAMENMGTTYDAAKMEQLHTAVYKVAVGMQLLEQLKSNLSVQLEMASTSVTNPAQYFNNQYITTVQNKTKLSEALNYINEAGSLVNINPYVSKDGLVFDQAKMGQLHDSINKLAVAVVELNKINDNFSQQSIQFSNLAQTSPTMTSIDMSGGLLSNINMNTVFNALVIVFILIFIISIFGYISRLLKSPKNSN